VIIDISGGILDIYKRIGIFMQVATGTYDINRSGVLKINRATAMLADRDNFRTIVRVY
jgi:hypothetical protein